MKEKKNELNNSICSYKNIINNNTNNIHTCTKTNRSVWMYGMCKNYKRKKKYLWCLVVEHAYIRYAIPSLTHNQLNIKLYYTKEGHVQRKYFLLSTWFHPLGLKELQCISTTNTNIYNLVISLSLIKTHEISLRYYPTSKLNKQIINFKCNFIIYRQFF